jgi:hypothetical protein
MAVAESAPAGQDQDSSSPDNPSGAVGRPAGPPPQAADFAPAGGGPPTEQPPPTLKERRKTEAEKSARPAYWDADISGGGAEKPEGKKETSAAAERPGYWDADMSGNEPAPAPAPAAPGEAPSTPIEEGFPVGTALETQLMAGGEQAAAGVQEVYGNHKYNAARLAYWQLMLGPDALQQAQQNQSSLTDDPLLQQTAKHLGMRVDTFTRGIPALAGMSPQERQQALEAAKQGMQDGADLKARAAAKRQEAGAMKKSFGTFENAPVTNEALNLASIAPELAAPIVATLAGGPVAGYFTGAAVATDFIARGYSNAKDALENQQAGANPFGGAAGTAIAKDFLTGQAQPAPEGAFPNQQLRNEDIAQAYGVLSGLAMFVPEVKLLQGLGPEGASLLLNGLNKATAQKAGSLAVNSAITGGVQQALMVGLDKGLLNSEMSLKDALTNVGVGMVEFGIIGPASHAAHGAVASARAPRPTGDELSNLPGAIVGRRVVEAGPANDIERAQRDAAAAVARMPDTDHLDQVKAMSEVGADVGAYHDAAAVHAAREQEHLANQMEIRRQQAEAADQGEQADIEQGQREQGLNQAAAQAAPETTPEQGFAQREQEAAKQKEADFSAAKNQQGEQAVEAAKTEEIGAEKGGANEPKPTLAEALPPEQLAALQSLKARRAAEAAKAPPAAEPTVAERLEAQNPEDNFQKLGPEVAPKGEKVPLKASKVPEEAIKGTEEPAAPAEEEEVQGKGPPPATAQTLAQRRQATLDAAMAAKVRGEPGAEQKVATSEQMAPQPNKLETAQPNRLETAPEPKTITAAPERLPAAEKPPNRLAAIRAAVEKKRPPLRQEYDPAEALMQAQVRRDMGLPEEEQAPAGEPAQENRPQPVTREARKQQLEDLRQQYNDGKITKEAYDEARRAVPAAETTAFAERRAENDWMTDKGTRETAEDLDRAMNPEMSHDEAKGHLAPISDALGPRSLMVHESHNDDAVPEKYKVQIDNYEAKNGDSKIKGFYDTDTGIAHVFADAHKAGDRDDIISTAAHELTHKGVDGMLGSKFGPAYRKIMLSLADAVKDTEWSKNLAKKRGLDLNDEEHRVHLANEYVAHVAENILAGEAKNKGLPVPKGAENAWQRAWDTIRMWGKAMGLGKEWTDRDIAQLVREAQSHVGGEPFKAARSATDRPPLFSADDNNKGKYSDENDWSGKQTVESQMPKGYKESLPEKTKEAMRQGAGKALKLTFLHNLPDMLNTRTRPLMPSPDHFVREHDDMEATRGAAQAEGAKVIDKWEGANLKNEKDGGENLYNTMHNTTLLKQDPSKPYVPGGDPAKEADARANYDIAKRQYDTLSPEEKKLYSGVRDQYSKMSVKEQKALEARINSTKASPALKEKYISLLRKQFEPSGRITPYFPLGRGDGDFWGVARDADGKTQSFVRLDSANQLRAWKTEVEKQHGFTTEGGQNMDSPAERRQLNPKFASEVADMARDIDPKFAEDVWQHYLRSMPEIASVKRGLPRIGRFGFTQDALHTFKKAVSAHSMLLARLEHGQRLNDLVESMKNEAHNVETDPKTTDADKMMAPAMAREFAERADLITNPKAAGWLASKITRLGYGWYLWWSPATAYRIGMQNPLLARPLIAKQFGALGASREMWKSFGEWAAHGGTQRYIDSLRDDNGVGSERTWAEHARNVGVITNTWAKTLLSGGPRPAGEVGQPQAKNPFMRGASAAINSGGWLFNAMEQKNRITTFMAAYRLGVKSGMHPEDAAASARAIVRNAHVDYSLVGRPSVLQRNDIARVIGQFKLYPAQVAYRLFREFRDVTRTDGGITPAQRMQATRALASIVGRGFLLGGLKSVAGYTVVAGLVNAYMHHEGDDKFDMTQSIKQHLTAMLGKRGASAIMHGAASAGSGFNAGSAADYSSLLYKSSDEDKNWKETVGEAITQLAGSPAGFAGGLASAADTGESPRGDVERGIEQGAPTELANLLKANRLWKEGALNMRGEPIIPREHIGAGTVAMRALGMTSEELLEQQEANTAFANAKKRILDHKASLEIKYERALNTGDSAGEAEFRAQIDQFNTANQDNPAAIIKSKGISTSIRAQAKAQATAVGGVDTKGFEGLAKEVQ